MNELATSFTLHKSISTPSMNNLLEPSNTISINSQ